MLSFSARGPLFALALIVAGFSLTPTSAASRTLSIQPVYQQTIVWCWAAVSEMVFRHYRVPNLNPGGNFQCGIVGSLGGPCWNDCRYCVQPIGDIYQMSQVLMNYQGMAGNYRFRAEPQDRLSFRGVMASIDRGNPLIAGISPSGMDYPRGMGEHVALIVGYDTGGNGWLKVNDPMPFAALGYDPYLRAGAERDGRGAYWISYENFVRFLRYNDSIILSR